MSRKLVIVSGYTVTDALVAGLGRELLERIQEVLARVQDNPDHFPVIRMSIRRAMLRRFPYNVLFRAADENVLVVAIMHFRRNPMRLRRRT